MPFNCLSVQLISEFLGAVGNSWKGTVRFVTSVRPSAWHNSDPTERILMKFEILVFWEHLSRKFKLYQYLTRIKGGNTSHEVSCTFMITSRWVLLRMRNVSDKVVEKIKTHLLCSIVFFENLAIYEIMWKNMVHPDRPQMTIWRICFACWITKATNILSAYVIINDF